MANQLAIDTLEALDNSDIFFALAQILPEVVENLQFRIEEHLCTAT